MRIRWEHRIFKPAAQHAHAGACEEEGKEGGGEEEADSAATTRIRPRINLTFHVHTAEEEKNENGGKVDDGGMGGSSAAPGPPKVQPLSRPSVLNQRKKRRKKK
jgi:hypothetical protein